MTVPEFLNSPLDKYEPSAFIQKKVEYNKKNNEAYAAGCTDYQEFMQKVIERMTSHGIPMNSPAWTDIMTHADNLAKTVIAKNVAAKYKPNPDGNYGKSIVESVLKFEKECEALTIPELTSKIEGLKAYKAESYMIATAHKVLKYKLIEVLTTPKKEHVHEWFTLGVYEDTLGCECGAMKPSGNIPAYSEHLAKIMQMAKAAGSENVKCHTYENPVGCFTVVIQTLPNKFKLYLFMEDLKAAGYDVVLESSDPATDGFTYITFNVQKPKGKTPLEEYDTLFGIDGSGVPKSVLVQLEEGLKVAGSGIKGENPEITKIGTPYGDFDKVTEIMLGGTPLKIVSSDKMQNDSLILMGSDLFVPMSLDVSVGGIMSLNAQKIPLEKLVKAALIKGLEIPESIVKKPMSVGEGLSLAAKLKQLQDDNKDELVEIDSKGNVIVLDPDKKPMKVSLVDIVPKKNPIMLVSPDEGIMAKQFIAEGNIKVGQKVYITGPKTVTGNPKPSQTVAVGVAIEAATMGNLVTVQITKDLDAALQAAGVQMESLKSMPGSELLMQVTGPFENESGGVQSFEDGDKQFVVAEAGADAHCVIFRMQSVEIQAITVLWKGSSLRAERVLNADGSTTYMILETHPQLGKRVLASQQYGAGLKLGPGGIMADAVTEFNTGDKTLSIKNVPKVFGIDIAKGQDETVVIFKSKANREIMKITHDGKIVIYGDTYFALNQKKIGRAHV